MGHAGLEAAESRHASADHDKQGKSPLSIEQQKQLLTGVYAAFWGLKIFVAGIVVCILGLHGACCLFPNYRASDEVSTFRCERASTRDFLLVHLTTLCNHQLLDYM